MEAIERTSEKMAGQQSDPAETAISVYQNQTGSVKGIKCRPGRNQQSSFLRGRKRESTRIQIYRTMIFVVHSGAWKYNEKE
ncbi:MAG: hypothetical protein ACLS5R_06450 [Blautia sp.]